MIELIGEPHPGSPRPFSHAARAGGMVFVSGHSAPQHGGSPAEETRAALHVMAAILKEAGTSMDRVVQVTMLLTDPADYEECNEEYVLHFPNGLPARHTVRFGVPTRARVAFACIALAGP